jgi:hypothetical protein
MIPPWVWGALVENSSPICNSTMWFYMGLGSMAKTGNSDPHNSTCKPPHSIQPVPIESYRRDLQFKNVGFLWGRIGHVNLNKIKGAELSAHASDTAYVSSDLRGLGTCLRHCVCMCYEVWAHASDHDGDDDDNADYDDDDDDDDDVDDHNGFYSFYFQLLYPEEDWLMYQGNTLRPSQYSNAPFPLDRNVINL